MNFSFIDSEKYFTVIEYENQYLLKNVITNLNGLETY